MLAIGAVFWRGVVGGGGVGLGGFGFLGVLYAPNYDFYLRDISFNIVWVGSGGLLAIGAVFWRGVVCGGGVGLGGFGFSGVLYAPNHDF